MQIIIAKSCAGAWGSFGSGQVLTVGAEIEKEMAMSFLNGGLANVVKQSQGETAEYPIHVGGGMYELSSGKRIRGKANARQAEMGE